MKFTEKETDLMWDSLVDVFLSVVEPLGFGQEPKKVGKTLRSLKRSEFETIIYHSVNLLIVLEILLEYLGNPEGRKKAKEHLERNKALLGFAIYAYESCSYGQKN